LWQPLQDPAAIRCPSARLPISWARTGAIAPEKIGMNAIIAEASVFTERRRAVISGFLGPDAEPAKTSIIAETGP
jgi:hypothetical protein